MSIVPIRFSRSIVKVVMVSALAMLLCVFVAGVAVAAQGQPGSEQCVECHWPETESWQASPHATQKVTCETCHGPYVPDHPEQGVMQIQADSKICMSCHEDTAAQWRSSQHAQKNVVCTGCHVSHSQDTRLSSEILCGSCHTEEIQNFTHTAHHAKGVTCTDCHSSKPEGDAARGHQFAAIDSKACISCHAQTIHEELGRANQEAQMQLTTLQTTSEDLATRLDAMNRQNRSLKAISVVSLGVGIGIGAVFGVIFVLGIFYFNRRGKPS